MIAAAELRYGGEELFSRASRNATSGGSAGSYDAGDFAEDELLAGRCSIARRWRI